MKSRIILLAVALSVPQISHAQGTMTYLSNLGQPSVGSLSVGSDSWLATVFLTGTNAGGYSLDSIQLATADASGNPSGFTVMLYANSGPATISPGSALGSLNGSLSPVTSGIYTYTPASSLALSPHTLYFIVLTAGTAIADGAYEWSLAGINSYNPSGDWAATGAVWTSSHGSSWPPPAGGNPQFAIYATAVPEPSTVALLALSGCFLAGRRALRSGGRVGI